MKNLLILPFICFAFFSAYSQQQPPIPISVYGVWDRGGVVFKDPTNPKYKFFKGSMLDLKWKDIQPVDSLHYNWAGFDDMVKIAGANGMSVYSEIFVGPDCPTWIYANGVPTVLTDDTKHSWPCYPYYLAPNYIRFYYKLIAEFGKHLRTLPENLRECVTFIQAMTGCTGDEVAYKGGPTNSQYNISDAQWLEFRIAAFSKWKAAFRDGDQSTRIPLLFNEINEDKNSSTALAWKWVVDSVGTFGVKSSASIRGHHLSGELSFKNTYSPYLYNQKGNVLFSRSEMDGGCRAPLYMINPGLAYYWGILNGLNTGTGIHDINKSGSDDALNIPEVMKSMLFFNKYASQIYGSTTIGGYCIFHEGLNSENSVKFPVTKYGLVDMGNTARYTAICNAYSSRGAMMGDLYATTKGNVYQRASQTTYNDAGWDIEEGNYERWISQINPDATSIGLFRVRGPITASSSKYDRFARSFENKSGKNTMYFKFWDEVFSSTNKPKSLKFTVTWLDKTAGSIWEFKYKNTQGLLQSAIQTIGVGDNTWKTVTTTITDMDVTHSGTNGSDFMLVNTDNLDDVFNGIEVDIEREQSQTAISVQTMDKEDAVLIYPNPTKSNVKLQSTKEIKYVEVCDLSGKLLMKIVKPIDNSINLSHLQKGMYFLKLSTDNCLVVKRIIKE